MSDKLRKVWRIIREGRFGEITIKLLDKIIEAIRKNERAACVKRTISYETSDYYSRIARPPKIRLVKSEDKAPRLNIILPYLCAKESYAGVKGAMELARHLSGHYNNIRFISLAALEGKALFDFNDYVINPSQKNIEVTSLADNRELACHENEIFLCTLWLTVLAWEAYSKALLAAGFNKNAFYYFIQDFEPGFHKFGYEYALTQETYSHHSLTHAIFNSQELHQFFKMRPISFAKEYVIKPSLDGAISGYLKSRDFKLKAKDGDIKRILIYGRIFDRNCFESIVEGLYKFFKEISPEERKGYSIVSAGGWPPENITLFPGLVIKSAGKLSIERYIEELERSHIGVSFMVSPHPSLPPLEMATFGLYTITNKFLNKDLSRCHPMIHSLGYPLPDELAEELKKAVQYISKKDAFPASAVLPDDMCSLSWKENLERAGITPIKSDNIR